MNQEQLNATIKAAMSAYQIGLHEGQGSGSFGMDIATFIAKLIDNKVDDDTLKASPLKPMTIKIKGDFSDIENKLSGIESKAERLRGLGLKGLSADDRLMELPEGLQITAGFNGSEGLIVDELTDGEGNHYRRQEGSHKMMTRGLDVDDTDVLQEG